MFFDTRQIRAASARRTVDTALAGLTLEPEPADLWSRPPREAVEREVLVVADLAELGRPEAWEHLLLLRARGVFYRLAIVALVRTEQDEASLASPDTALRLSEGRMFLCEARRMKGRPQGEKAAWFSTFFASLIASLAPDRLASVEFADVDQVLWMKFGDGYRRALAWKNLPLADRKPALLPVSARLAEQGTAVAFLDEAGGEVEIDAAALRALVDRRERGRQGSQAAASARALGKKLRSIRSACGLTQEQLAARSGLPQASLSRIEKGSRLPKLETLQKYANGVGMSLSDLLAGLRA